MLGLIYAPRVCRITFETRSVRDASTVATPASRDATASAAQIAIGQTLVPSHMSKERFGMTSNFAAALAKAGGLAETAKLGEYDLQLAHPAVSPLIPTMTLLSACVSSLKNSLHILAAARQTPRDL